MKDEVRIRLHSDPEVPGTRWWAESDTGFTGGADGLNDLVATVQEWAAVDGVQVSFRLILEEAPSSESEFVDPIIHSGAEMFTRPSTSESGPKFRFTQVPLSTPV